MLRISKMADYATGVISHLARAPDRQVSAQQLALESGLPLPTVARLLKRLASAGLVRGARGAGGGYGLARTPEEISMADVINAIEGPVALTECALGSGHCSLESHCATRAHWRQIDHAVRTVLATVKLADMATVQPRSIRFQVTRELE